MNARRPDARDAEAQRSEYQRLFTAAADALEAAIRTRITDGGETATCLLATVAANLGGSHLVTAGRPGSWEAHQVIELLAATVGADDEYLLAYRTRAIEVVECLDLVEADAGLADLYDEVLGWIDRYEHTTTVATDDAAAADASLTRLDHAERLLDQLRATDHQAYRDAFEQHVRAAADKLVRTRGLSPDLPVTVRWVDWEHHNQATGEQDTWGSVEHQLWEHARTRTPLPGLVDDPPTQGAGELIAQLGAAGRLPHQRIPELARYHHLTGPPESAGRAGEG